MFFSFLFSFGGLKIWSGALLQGKEWETCFWAFWTLHFSPQICKRSDFKRWVFHYSAATCPWYPLVHQSYLWEVFATDSRFISSFLFNWSWYLSLMIMINLQWVAEFIDLISFLCHNSYLYIYSWISICEQNQYDANLSPKFMFAIDMANHLGNQAFSPCISWILINLPSTTIWGWILIS